MNPLVGLFKILLVLSPLSLLFVFKDETINTYRLLSKASEILHDEEVPFEELPILIDVKDDFMTGAKIISQYAQKLLEFNEITETSDIVDLKGEELESRSQSSPSRKWRWDRDERETSLRKMFSGKKYKHMLAYTAYIEEYKSLAQQEMIRTGIAASITLAQGLLEANAGRSFLATRANNHFGIKCKGKGGRTPHRSFALDCVNRCDDSCDDYFNIYEDVVASYQHHSWLLQQERYRKIFAYDIGKVYFDEGEQKPYFEMVAKALKSAGYATSERYAQKLAYIIETYHLYLIDYEVIETVNI